MLWVLHEFIVDIVNITYFVLTFISNFLSLSVVEFIIGTYFYFVDIGSVKYSEVTGLGTPANSFNHPT